MIARGCRCPDALFCALDDLYGRNEGKFVEVLICMVVERCEGG